MATNLDLLRQEVEDTNRRAGQNALQAQAAATAFNNFRSSIYTSGTLQDNKFDVVFEKLPFLTNENKQLLTLRAHQVDIPSLGLQTTNIHRYGFGPPVQYPVNVQYTPVTIKFIVDKQGLLYKFFTTWLNGIFSQDIDQRKYGSLYRVEYKDAYSSDIDILVYDNYGEKQMEFKLNEAFPLQLQETPLSWNIQNQLIIVSVQFVYSSWQQTSPGPLSPLATPRPQAKPRPPETTQVVGWTPTSDKETFGYSVDGT